MRSFHGVKDRIYSTERKSTAQLEIDRSDLERSLKGTPTVGAQRCEGAALRYLKNTTLCTFNAVPVWRWYSLTALL